MTFLCNQCPEDAAWEGDDLTAHCAASGHCSFHNADSPRLHDRRWIDAPPVVTSTDFEGATE